MVIRVDAAMMSAPSCSALSMYSLGDTLIPTMLAGNAVQYARTPLQAMRTLAAHIGLITSTDVTGQAYHSLFAAGGLLLLFSAAASLTVRRLKAEKEKCA